MFNEAISTGIKSSRTERLEKQLGQSKQLREHSDDFAALFAYDKGTSKRQRGQKKHEVSFVVHDEQQRRWQSAQK
jgi:hypothetical protein